MITTKLTLTIEKEIIEEAKACARETGRSLSELIVRHLESITDLKDLKKDRQN